MCVTLQFSGFVFGSHACFDKIVTQWVLVVPVLERQKDPMQSKPVRPRTVRDTISLRCSLNDASLHTHVHTYLLAHKCTHGETTHYAMRTMVVTLLIFGDRVLICNSGCPRAHYMDQGGHFKLTLPRVHPILTTHRSQCWDLVLLASPTTLCHFRFEPVSNM